MAKPLARSYYHAPTLEHAAYKKIVERYCNTIKKMRKQGYDVEAIAFTGLSGSAIAYGVFYRLGIPMLYVRKTSYSSHGLPVEATPGSYRSYVFVDDLISTGETLNRVIDTLDSYGLTCEAVITSVEGGNMATFKRPGLKHFCLGLDWGGDNYTSPTKITAKDVTFNATVLKGGEWYAW